MMLPTIYYHQTTIFYLIIAQPMDEQQIVSKMLCKYKHLWIFSLPEALHIHSKNLICIQAADSG